MKDPKKAQSLARFFKTGKGEYGEGDVFWGLTVPEQRRIAKKHSSLSLSEVEKLLHSKVHEHRLTALLLLGEKYRKGDCSGKEEIYRLYLRNTKRVNNWDMVDLSAPHIIGDYVLDGDKTILRKLANSANLWERRIAILATFPGIKENKFDEALNIAELLLRDRDDLIHKAVGWMLREIGKRDQEVEEQFLKRHYRLMPRTMLRYAIERFDEKKRKFYLSSSVRIGSSRASF